MGLGVHIRNGEDKSGSEHRVHGTHGSIHRQPLTRVATEANGGWNHSDVPPVSVIQPLSFLSHRLFCYLLFFVTYNQGLCTLKKIVYLKVLYAHTRANTHGGRGERERGESSTHQFPPQMASTAKVGAGKSKEPGASSWFLIWVAEGGRGWQRVIEVQTPGPSPQTIVMLIPLQSLL